ncbi:MULTISPECIES: SDR family oxidoreductase [Methanothrix]|uniref:SDR family oxidoreductase n=1 Tax=Methanothrix TaxID=2222 RepID=UPI0025FCACCF|nr:SDR family oxidoreductase [Methanothrix sp.]MCK9405088.1 SDR family oxidoreductase [Methanothrix sp.]
MLKNKRIVITGGAGFIGSNIARSLCEENEVIVIDNLLTGCYENISDIADHIRFVRDDVNNLDMLMNEFLSVDYVLHQAALPSVQRSVEDPITSNMNNIDGTLKVLVAALDCDVKKVVCASSSSVYGDTPILPKQEEMKPNPKSPYAITKLAGEYYSRVFSEVYGLKTVCLRYFNVFGPRQNPSSQYAAVIPLFITRILNRKSPIIFGDGLQTRDFTFVKDVVQANVLAMESPAEGVFNIACGHQITLNDLADRIMKIVGIEVKKVYDRPRKGDIKDSLADITYAREMLGYEPKFDLNSGLKETIAWFQKK